MNRRDLLRAIPAIAAIPGVAVRIAGQEVGQKFELDAKSKYLCIVNDDAINLETFCSSYGPEYHGQGLPPGTPVFGVPGHVPLDDVLRIYKIDD